ncbi:hypothetical protein TI05_11780, partial [Achromatium sp. WMS3]
LKEALVLQDGPTNHYCHPIIMEPIVRQLPYPEYKKILDKLRELLPINPYIHKDPRFYMLFITRNQDLNYTYGNYELALRELRAALLAGDLETFTKIINVIKKDFRNEMFQVPYMTQLIERPYDQTWFNSLKDDIKIFIGNLKIIQALSYQTSTNDQPLLDTTLDWCRNNHSNCTADLCYNTGLFYLLCGNFTELTQLINRCPEPQSLKLQGAMAIIRGQDLEGITLLERGYKMQLDQKKNKKTSSNWRNKVVLQGIPGILLIYALIRQGSAEYLQQAGQYITTFQKQQSDLKYYTGYFKKFLELKQHDNPQTMEYPRWNDSNIINLLISHLMYWHNQQEELLEFDMADAEATSHKIYDHGYLWLASEFFEIFGRIAFDKQHLLEKAAELRAKWQGQSLINAVVPEQKWERALRVLSNLDANTKDTTAATESKQERLVWMLKYHQQDNYCTATPKLQKLNKNGQWTKGRNISLQRLYENIDQLDYLTDQDRQACRTISQRHDHNYYYDRTFYELHEDKLIKALIGHPLLFWLDSPTVAVEVLSGEPSLRVIHKKKQLLIALDPTPSDIDTNIMIQRESPTRLRVIEIKPEQYRIYEILETLGQDGQLSVPIEAKDQVLEMLGRTASQITIHSDIGGSSTALREVEANSQLHCHLLPAGNGLRTELLVRPFGDVGPYYAPGTGGQTVISEVEGESLQTHRDLKQEQQQVQEILQKIPLFNDYPPEEGLIWLFDDPELCLELLVTLQEHGDTITVEWPEGQKFKVSPITGANQMRLKVSSTQDWFALDGNLTLNDGRVLDMQNLLGLLEQETGRFLPIGDGEFIALSKRFSKQLHDLQALSDTQDKQLRLHPLAALTALDELSEEVGNFKGDKQWQNHKKQLIKLKDYHPAIPSTLQTELRDYQQEGFQWLARLAKWPMGACLADDMGLGKTVQALALLLLHAADGPALVVAPTSVAMNWLDEGVRFAPTLRLHHLGMQEDRQQLLSEIGPYDVVITSYTLLQNEIETLATKKWQTIILDEAQAIKNPLTKRAQAAIKLDGKFKMITTGTPIENRLSELWSLFRFINPGLLGSLKRFNERFATPIEMHQHKETRFRLRRLIQPFMLRRTKSQVLQELPPRTEIVHHVELSSKELTFYEALRRKALDTIHGIDDAPGHKQLQILAEITRLRRACCNPKLIKPEISIPSAKLEAFSEIVEDLLANHHKVLVFSQFVDHLTIIREYLDKNQITYQYLDGSTPAKDRKRRVNNFQAGEGDLFLISLKAGGFGLNLTAADYVIHMDPWWNPAVEDQASDRAHRIGQQRPVTVYRLVAKGTIEEKIIALHHQKRDLADSLLEGSDVGSKMSVDEMLHLLEEGL